MDKKYHLDKFCCIIYDLLVRIGLPEKEEMRVKNKK